MTTTKRKATASNIPPDADPGVPPEVHAMLMANPPTEEEKAQWLENMRQSRSDYLYLDGIRERVLAEHGDCWIAAYKGEVVAMADTAPELYDLLDERGIPRDKPAIWHFQRNPRPRIGRLPQWR